ncbi:MAG: hypothetical protein J3Q66DRAFT_132020 [Benniella sp.]|nr:MAG: hypothetical protein J3Q66DRAFT_132020 [Benniella sp.]
MNSLRTTFCLNHIRALVPTEWMPMKVKQLTTDELIEDNTIDAKMLCEWEGHDIKIVIGPTPTLASKRFLSNLRVGDDVQVKGKLLVTGHRKQKERAIKSSLILKEAEIMGPSKYGEFQTDPAVDLIMDPVYFFQCLADPSKSYMSTPLPPLEPGRPLRIPLCTGVVHVQSFLKKRPRRRHRQSIQVRRERSKISPIYGKVVAPFCSTERDVRLFLEEDC